MDYNIYETYFTLSSFLGIKVDLSQRGEALSMTRITFSQNIYPVPRMIDFIKSLTRIYCILIFKKTSILTWFRPSVTFESARKMKTNS